MKKCMFIYGKDGTLLRFPREEQDKLIKNIIEPMASDGLRTICIAYKDYVKRKPSAQANEIQMEGEPDWEDEDSIISRLTCLAIIGIEDPVRPEVSPCLFPLKGFALFTITKCSNKPKGTLKCIPSKANII